jgi:acyl carrier protein
MIDDQVVMVLRSHMADLPPEASVDTEDKLVDLGIDSLRLVELIIELEDAFDIVIPDEEMLASNFSTVGAVSALVARIRSAG